MAIENAKLLNVRIKNKYDSYENWASSGLILERGEIAIAYTTVDVKVDNGTAKHPALLMKVGDGASTFAQLPWLSAKAADVLKKKKNEAELKTFVNNVIADAGIATDDALTALAGRVTTAEGAITTLNGLVGTTSVQAQISSEIAALNLAETYAAKEHNHEMSEINGLSDEFAKYQLSGNYSVEGHKHVKADITDFAHNHEMAEVNGLVEALAGKETVGEALEEHGLVSGEEGPYGLYIKKVNGITADYDIDQSYWSFNKNGEYMMTGADKTEIENGAHYELVYTK